MNEAMIDSDSAHVVISFKKLLHYTQPVDYVITLVFMKLTTHPLSTHDFAQYLHSFFAKIRRPVPFGESVFFITCSGGTLGGGKEDTSFSPEFRPFDQPPIFYI